MPPPYAVIDVTLAGAGKSTLIPGVPGQRIVVIGYFAVVSADMGIRFHSHQSGVYTPISGIVPLAAKSGVDRPWREPGLFQTAVGADLAIEGDAAGTIGGDLAYKTVPES